MLQRFQAGLVGLHHVAPLLNSPDGRLGLAVSGGPDSLALLLLFASAFSDRAVAFTVDHGLRPESADEAAGVAAICAKLGVAHSILHVPELKAVHSNIQAQARAARYRVMGDACKRAGVGALLTAHHADDQAETMLLRLARGSGLAGLCGIRAERVIDGLVIGRPLLGWRKAELARLVEGAGYVAFDDPSNRSDAYDRTAARKLVMNNPELIDPLRLAASAAHLSEAEAALQWVTELGWKSRSQMDGEAVYLDVEDLPSEVRRRLVLRAMMLLRPDAAPDGPSVDRLIANVASGRQSTLAGIQVSQGRKWRFVVAKPHQG